MSDRLKTAERLIEQLSPKELSEFARWFADYQDGLWEKQLEADSNQGKLDAAVKQAHEAFEAGNVREI